MRGFLCYSKAMKSIVLIDGSNFYYKIKDLKLGKLWDFDFGRFAQNVAGGTTVVARKFYVGKVRQDGTEKADAMVANQQKLFANLKKSNFQYVLGFLMKNDGKYHEKGVDVQIATDILVAAYESQCDRIILVSSDTDLGPAIKKAREIGKKVEYIGFSHMPSVGMVKFCSESTLLKKSDLENLFTA